MMISENKKVCQLVSPETMPHTKKKRSFFLFAINIFFTVNNMKSNYMIQNNFISILYLRLSLQMFCSSTVVMSFTHFHPFEIKFKFI